MAKPQVTDLLAFGNRACCMCTKTFLCGFSHCQSGGITCAEADPEHCSERRSLALPFQSGPDEPEHWMPTHEA